MRVSDILKRKGGQVITARPDERIHSVLDMMLKRNIGAVVVTNADKRPVGIISEREILEALQEHGADIFKLRSDEVMRRALRACDDEDTVQDIMAIMTDYRVRHLPVVQDGKLAGIVSLGDVVKYRLQEMEEEKNILRDSLVARSGSSF